MSTQNAPAVAGGGQLVASLATESGSMTVEQIKANRELMKKVMGELMEPGVHYGKVPGTDKPTLLKPGAELLCVVFRVNAKPTVEDLSDDDCVRYRVTMTGVHIPTGQEIATGLGECSTDEDKYKWRAAKNRSEFDETPSDRRRWKWTGSGESDGKNQVRTNPADAANTVLKMAEKRAKVDLALSFSAASDVFNQDLDDIAEWLRDKETGNEPEGPRGKAGTNAPRQKAPSSSGQQQSGKINANQLGVLKGEADRAGVSENALLEKFGVAKLEDLPFAELNNALMYCKKIHDGGG